MLSIHLNTLNSLSGLKNEGEIDQCLARRTMSIEIIHSDNLLGCLRL